MLKKLFCPLVILGIMLFMNPGKASAAVLPWEAMVNSTFTSAPRSPGFGDPNNILAISMVTLNNYVYVSNYNDTTGTEIWRSSSGTDWEQVNANGFGTEADSFAILAVFNNSLYAFNWFWVEDHVDVYRYNSGTSWDNTATIDNMSDPTASIVYNNTLYIGLYTGGGASAIYGSTDGSTWNMVNNDGFVDANNEIIQSMAIYNNRLYAGTWNENTGTEVWYYDGSNWAQDNSDGFDGAQNISTGSLTSFGGVLYASTRNDTTGAEVWKTTGGGPIDWEKVSDTGFGQGVGTNYTLGSSVFKNKLYIGATSAKVFRTADGSSWEQVNTDGFGYDDNDLVIFTILGDYLYAGTGLIPGLRGQGGPDTTEIYRYYEASALPQTGYDNPLNAYILDALL